MFIPPLRIALSGGGIRGIAHIGALQVLHERGYLRNVIEYLGISAGAFCAFCLCVGCTLIELHDVITQLDFSLIRHLEPETCMAFPDNFGLDDGANLTRLIDAVLRTKGLPPDITFGALAAHAATTGLPALRIYATNLNRCAHMEFSATATPAHEVRLGLRASMTIPFYFTPVKDPFTGELLVDGGLVTHCPFQLLPYHEKQHALGFRFSFDHKLTQSVESLPAFMKQVYFTFDFQELRALERIWPNHIVHLPCGAVQGLHFEASREDREAMIQAGREGMSQFLDKFRGRPPPRRFSAS